MHHDTIAAIATAAGEAALALLRVSGPRALEVARGVWRGGELKPRRAVHGRVVDAEERTLDSVLATYFRRPASYTGEDVVEISCHGGLVVAQAILQALLRAGARTAEPGEFTQRAFLNGKLDLTQAEAVMDVISARSLLSLRAAQQQLAGDLGRRVEALRESVLTLLAHVEAWLDFPEEDIDPDSAAALQARLQEVRDGVERLLSTADQGRILRDGMATVIAGAPNVGKSSLLNRLAGFDRAIVSPRAGTTRDTIEEVVRLGGIPLRLIDTAGLRTASDDIEAEGIARTRRALGEADLVLRVVDASRPRQELEPLASGAAEILILNKIDLGEDPSWSGISGVRVSCLEGQGLEALSEEVWRRVTEGRISWNAELVAINARHQAALEKARGWLLQAAALMEQGGGFELLAEELRAALRALGEILGQIDAEDLLGVIFGRFCIGK